MFSDTVDSAASLFGVNMAILRGLLGPDTAAVVGAVVISVMFLLALLAVALPISLAITRLVDWARLNVILRRMVTGDDGSVLTRKIKTTEE